MLDSRLAALNPTTEADCIVSTSSFHEAKLAIRKISESTDAAYIIAPESNQALQSLVESIERANVSSLNCRASAIEKVSDKAAKLKHTKEMGLPTPETVIVSAFDDVTEIKKTIRDSLVFPLIARLRMKLLNWLRWL